MALHSTGALASGLSPARSDRRVIGLVSAGHFLSHFYLLLLPPLFPVLRDVYGVGYTELGLAFTAFSLTTGLLQAPIGFVVDRVGARSILLAGVLLESLAISLVGVFPVYGALLGLMVVAGAANAAFHPADYAILNASVHEARMGRAFSIHTAAGNLGDAMGPVSVLFLAGLFGWRGALLACGLAGVLVVVLMWSNAGLLRDATHAAQPASRPAVSRHPSGVALLLSAPVIMGLLFFLGVSVASRGMTGFSVSALTILYHAPLDRAGLVLSAYLFAVPVGVLGGGWVADRMRRHERVAAGCFVGIALAIGCVGLFSPSLPAVAVLFVLGGLLSGLVSPSRDMMIRAITPPGQVGKVFGFVSTGFNLGGVIGPPLYGWMLDHNDPRAVFWLVAAVCALSVVTVLETGRRGRAAR